MIECKIDHGEGEVNIGGNLLEQAADIAVLIHVAFNRFVSEYPALRDYAKAVLQNAAEDETGVIFKLDSELDAEILDAEFRENEGNHMPGTSME